MYRLGIALFIAFCSFCSLLNMRAQGDYTIAKGKSLQSLEQIDRGETLRGYRLDRYTGFPYPAQIDTMDRDYYRRCMAEGESLAVGYTGNLMSPRHYKTFFDRPTELPRFLYSNAYHRLRYNIDNLQFFDTKTPYGSMLYQRNGEVEQREEELDLLLTTNINPKLNVGGAFNYTYSRGQYIANFSSGVSYRLFGSLILPRYELYASVGHNYFKQNENGGLANDEYIENPDRFSSGRNNISSGEIPVLFPSKVGNSMWLGHGMLFHRYNLGTYLPYKEGEPMPNGKKAAQDTTFFVPFGSLGHRFEYNKDVRMYMAYQAPLLDKVYGKTHRHYWKHSDWVQDSLLFIPIDSTRMERYANTISLSLREGFRPWVKFGLTGYARLENTFYHIPDSVAHGISKREFSTYIGGRATRVVGTGLNFDVGGEIALLGADLGSMRLSGNASSQFSLGAFPFKVEGDARLSLLRVPYLWEHHHGSYVWWNKDFSFTRQFVFGGSIGSSLIGTEFSAHSATLGNVVYFGSDRLPYQYDKPIEVLELRFKHRYKWLFLGWQGDVSYQLCSNQEVLPLPTLSAYGSLYLDFLVAGVMHTQIGADCYYHTAYYAPYYEPATQQFTLQDKLKVGNFPMLNAFANIKIQRIRFFVMMYNVGESIFRNSRRWSLAHYPINPQTLRIGINFDFYN